MQYSIATVCLSGTLRQKIEAIAKAGFQGIEIFENDLITHDGSLGELRQLLADHRLKVLVYQPFRDFEGMPEPLRSRGFARAEQKFELMREIGTDLLMICSNVSPKAIGGIQRAAEDLFELTELAPVSARLSNDRHNSSNSSLSPGHYHRNKPGLRSVMVWAGAYSRASHLVGGLFAEPPRRFFRTTVQIVVPRCFHRWRV